MVDTKLTKPFADYPHAKRVSNLLFIAGQGCRDPQTNAYAGLELNEKHEVVRYDIKAQTLGVLANLERVLQAHGLDRRHLVDITVFLMSMEDFNIMNAVWNGFFSGFSPPTRTTVAVSRLPGHNFIEMKAIATFEQP